MLTGKNNLRIHLPILLDSALAVIVAGVWLVGKITVRSLAGEGNECLGSPILIVVGQTLDAGDRVVEAACHMQAVYKMVGRRQCRSWPCFP